MTRTLADARWTIAPIATAADRAETMPPSMVRDIIRMLTPAQVTAWYANLRRVNDERAIACFNGDSTYDRADADATFALLCLISDIRCGRA